MNSKSNSTESFDAESPADNLAEALIREHARLGSRDDEELISRILVRTFGKSATAPVNPSNVQKMTTREWVQMGTAVAAVIAVLLLALSMLQFRNGRTSDTFHMTVEFVEEPSDEVELTTVTNVSPARKSARPFRNDYYPRIEIGDAVSSVTIEDQDFNLVTHFERSFKSLPVKATRNESFTITSDKSTHLGNEILYEGEVIMKHRDFVLTAAILRLVASETDSSQTPAFVAEIAEIRHRASSSVATAALVVFDTASGSLIASGVTNLRNAAGEAQAIDDANEHLVFNGARMEILPIKLEILANPLPILR